ncbi:AcrR family transcriptional regulator [Kibdelosporangium banguiense]|uniref:AcrR family transcriptional regulator n=1 Tax=Kibdelosporangium banguiense TaxID=1365924 RepID=A0ABS4TLA5_9PSEU|nr:TetR/AcrR family transcriptional regulator [Kibdelosporangium banguiense]MBP2325217.1 AcrR family transcriptional regulator [Kibdelosporangium banguiense]
MQRQAAGLRERKKARTRTAIQQHALRLFREQGYQATTVDQIAEAAEVAPSTVFRYFATKEDLAVLDDYYSLAETIAAALAAQPGTTHPVEALRDALRVAFGGLTDEERAARYERDLLMVTIPELWSANLGMIVTGRKMIRDQMTSRAPGKGVLVDAAIGVALGVLLDWVKQPDGDPAAALDEALTELLASAR